MENRRRTVVAGVIVGLVVLVAAWILAGWLPTRNTETPDYAVVTRADGYEVRRYEPYLVAEVAVAGGYDEALSRGFRILFAYISGANEGARKIPMTAPVLEEGAPGGERLDMTAPVFREEEGEAHRIAFVVPSAYTAETVPRPENPDIRIRPVPGGRFAVLRFSGYATERRVGEERRRLAWFLARDGLVPTTGYRLAQYDPPWTPPFLRRNEIVVGIE